MYEELPEVDEIINNHLVVIFSKPKCYYCDLAADLLTEKNVSFIKFNIGDYLNDENFDTFYDNLIKKSGQKTFPMIFMKQTFIGGYSELKELCDSINTPEGD